MADNRGKTESGRQQSLRPPSRRELRVRRKPRVTDREVEMVEKGEDPDPNPLAPPVNIQGGG